METDCNDFKKEKSSDEVVITLSKGYSKLIGKPIELSLLIRVK